MSDNTAKTPQSLFAALSPYPWHVKLSQCDDDDGGGDGTHLLAVPLEDEEDIEIHALQVKGGEVTASVTGKWDPEDLADFCRTTLAILEERNLLDAEDDD